MHRFVLSSALSALLIGGVLPLTGTASAAACPTWTDDAGDAGLLVAEDASVDITKVSVEAGVTGLKTTITVPELGEFNEYTPGDRFQLAMDAAGTAVTVITDRDDFGLYGDSGVIVGNTLTSGGTATYDIEDHRVVITMPYSVFDDALGKPFRGLALTSLAAGARANLPFAATEFFDEAPAPPSVTMVGATPCGGAATGPAPAPKPVPAVPAAGPIPPGIPSNGCADVIDPKSDAHPFNGAVPNDPDLDITGLALRSTDREFLAYIKVDALGAAPATGDGHRYSIDFAFNGHAFTVAASSYKNAQSATVRETLASTGKNGKMVQMSVDGVTAIGVGTAPDYAAGQASPPYVDSDSKAAYDRTTGYVTIAVPIADIQKYGGAAFAGSTLTAVTAKASVDYYRNSFVADSTAESNGAASEYAWRTGDNKCFSVGTRLALSVAKTPAKRAVTARLTTATGQPLDGKTVLFFVNGVRVATARTSTGGTAVIKNVKPGRTVKAQFVAVPGYLGSTATTKV